MKTAATHTTTLFLDLQIEIEYAYDPGEREVRYYRNGDGHPGSPPSVEITKIYIEGDETKTDISKLLPVEEFNQLQADVLEDHDPEGDCE